MAKDFHKAIAGLKYDAEGLIPAVIVEAASGEVLMLAYMNRLSLERTIRTGKTHFWSRSRGRLWMKGEQSGHTQQVQAIYLDCDSDALLVAVRQRGRAACHEGYRSCFHRRLGADRRWRVVARRIFDPKAVYTRPARGKDS